MKLGICSWSFHRLLEAGKQDMFSYITDSKRLGATQLEPWNGHLEGILKGDEAVRTKADPSHIQLNSEELEYIHRVKKAIQDSGLPLGCLAIDGAHIYESTESARLGNQAVAFRWIEVARLLGAKQVRIDAGGPPEMPEDIFRIILEGYQDVIARAESAGLDVLVENHWGPTNNPDNVIRLMDALPKLGLLFDTNNWIKERQEEGWEKCARYAQSTHFKTFSFDASGNDPSVNLEKAVQILIKVGYQGCWGVESVPLDGDEYAGVEKTFIFLRKTVAKFS